MWARLFITLGDQKQIFASDTDGVSINRQFIAADLLGRRSIPPSQISRDRDLNSEFKQVALLLPEQLARVGGTQGN